MRVLVTGGAGFIGSHTCVELLQKGFSVHVVDNLSFGNQQNLKRVEKITKYQLSFSKIDLLSEKGLHRVFSKFRPEAVIHFAGLKSVNTSFSNALDYYQNNVIGTLNLIRVMESHDCQKLIFSSSATVYGNPDYLPIDEKHPKKPKDPYGRSKYFIEEILRDYTNSNKNFLTIILRYFNPIGAHPSRLLGETFVQRPENLLPYVSHAAKFTDKSLNIFGNDYDTRDGTGERDFVHVTDVAGAHVKALRWLKYDNKNRFFDFNVGTGRGTTVLELVKTFEKANNVKISVKFSNRRDGDVASCWADCQKIEKTLNWKAKRTIDEMCQDSWNWSEKFPSKIPTYY